ncbi:MAG: hypothetical protein WDO13_00845 [Verrucomicrobiota bacterium]
MVFGYGLFGIALLSVVLMAVEFKMISDLATRLQDDAESRKRKREFMEKIDAPAC